MSERQEPIWRVEDNTLLFLDPVSKGLNFYEFNNKAQLQEVMKKLRLKGDIPADSGALAKTPAPLNVTIQITNACNLLCSHCHRSAQGSVALSLEKFKSIIDQLREMKVFNVNISGGEPTLVPYLLQMVAYATELGLNVTMSTNATNMTKDLANKLYQSGLRRVHVSLDSCIPESHDELRGKPGSQSAMVRGLGFLKDAGIEFTLVTTVSSQSPKEYSDTIDFAHELGAGGHKTNTIIPQGRAKMLTPNRNINDYIKVFRKKRKEYQGRMSVIAETMFKIQIGKAEIAPQNIPRILRIGCPAAIWTANINESGEVNPCPFFSDYSLGNFFESGFRNIWEGERAERLRDESVEYSGDGCKARVVSSNVAKGEFES